MHVILISKDMFPARDLTAYGNTKNHTPVIDNLVKTGTLFTDCISPCPSSAMTYSCIWVGKQPYDLLPKDLNGSSKEYNSESIFSRFAESGVKSHVIWDKYWTSKGRHHLLPIYDQDTQFHNLDIYSEIGIHRLGASAKKRVFDSGVTEPLVQIVQAIKGIQRKESNSFTWLHCPHILAGYNSIGSDIEYFDRIIGEILNYFDRDQVFVLSDHGHMDFQSGEVLYGKSMHQNVLHVPLISPVLNCGNKIIDEPFSSVRLPELILERKVVIDPYIFSINQLPNQPNRTLAIRKGRYKYLYLKKYKAEALFDLDFDPLEQRNLLLQEVYSRAKKRSIALDQAFQYETWDAAEEAYISLKAQRKSVWQDPNVWENSFGLCKNLIRDGLWASFRDRFFPPHKYNGRWDSDAVSQFFHF